MEADTLRAKLERLQKLKAPAEEFDIASLKDQLRDVETRVLKDFYGKDPLAYAVSRGTDSYLTRIEPIEEKYATFWKRVKPPKMDEAYDNEVKRVVGSMLNVGMIKYWCHEFTTEGRRFYFMACNIFLLGGGGVIGLLGSGLNITTSSGMYALAAMSLAPAAMFNGMVLPSVKASIKDLKHSAKKTDEFLRKYPI